MSKYNCKDSKQKISTKRCLKMKHINELNLKHAFIVNDKFIAIKANKRNVLKVRSKYFSNYPLLYVVLNGTRYQINDKQFDFKHGII